MPLPRNSLTHFEFSFLFLDISVMMLPKLRNIVLLLFTCLTLFSTFFIEKTEHTDTGIIWVKNRDYTKK